MFGKKRSRRQRSVLEQLSLRGRAVDHLSTYILAAQPAVLENLPRGQKALPPDPEDPENLNPMSWWRAKHSLNLAPGKWQIADILLEATDQAAELANQQGIDLPLTAPQRFSELSDREWAIIASYFWHRPVQRGKQSL